MQWALAEGCGDRCGYQLGRRREIGAYVVGVLRVRAGQ